MDEQVVDGAVQDPAGDSGQVAAPGTDEAHKYGEFATPEELYAAFQTREEERKALADKAANLEALKGRMGNDIGQLRQQLANYEGQLRAAQQQREQQAAQQYDTAKIHEALAKGEIDEATALREFDKLVSAKYEGKLNTLQQRIVQFQQEMQSKEYVTDFLSKNPGYKEAYESGALNQWLNRGVPGEEAWLHYKVEQASTKAAELERKMAEARKTGEQAGLQKGVQLEKGKFGAGKVLGDGGGRLPGGNAPGYANKSQRAEVGYQYLQKIRQASR